MTKYDKAVGFWFDKSSKMWCPYLPKLVKKAFDNMYEYAMSEFDKTAVLGFVKSTVVNVMFAKTIVKKSLT